MKFEIVSREEIEGRYTPPKTYHAVISITNPHDRVAQIPINDFTRGILRLSFWDLEAPFIGYSRVPARDDAQKIIKFVKQVLKPPTVQKIVCHCEHGISRSAAVCAALSAVLNGDGGTWVFNDGRYRPNRRLYDLIIDEARKT